MPKRSKKQAELDRAREQERLQSPINPTGEGEDPAIKALLSDDFLGMSNLDATSVALMLQQIIRGQNSLLSLADQNSRDIALLKQRQDKIDQDMIQRAAAQKSEIEDILQRAEKLKLTGDAKERIVAKGGKMFTEAVKKAKARKASDRLVYEKQLAAQPKEIVTAHGRVEQYMEGGQQKVRLAPEEIRIKHKVWVLQPGIPTEVPASVAQVLRDRYASQAETQQRRAVLSKHLEANKLAEEWSKVEGSKTAALPTVNVS